jgi:hypothetical protein
MVKNLTHKSLQVFNEDHGTFKKLAANKGIRMDMLFQEIMQAYPTWPVVKQETPAGDTHEIP